MVKLFKSWFEGFIRNISGPLGRKLRYFYYRKQLAYCGKNVIIDEGVYFDNPKLITIHNNVWLDRNTILTAGVFNAQSRNYKIKGEIIIPWGTITIEEGVHIAPFSLVQGHGGVKIGRNVTIASGSKIYTLSHHYKNELDPTDTKRYSFSSMANQEDQFLIVGNVIIGNNAAIGLNSVVLPGTLVPDGTWLGVLSQFPKEILQTNKIYKSK